MSEATTMSDQQPAPTFQELKRLRTPLRAVNVEYRKKLSRLELLAIWITERVGTMGFFLAIFVWTIVWLGWNTLAPEAVRFDPFPAFVLWLFLSNVIQIFLMPLIMVGQNLQGRHAETRAQADFEVNTKAEREIEAILLHLEAQNDLILQILRHLEGTSSPSSANG
jgi:uncharacterized membrane protein